MLLNNKQVAIIGGGPGGLTLARLLQNQGVDVNVYERDVNKEARVQGSPLDLHDGSGLAAIKQAGLLDEFKQNFLPGADKKLITNEKAEIVFSDHDTKTDENFDSIYFRPEIDRGALRKLLLESLEPQVMVWDSHFVSMETQNEGWLLHFRNGASVYADLVIAADGANSKIRPYITDIKPFYSGITMLEGNIYQAQNTAPIMYKLLNGGKIMAFGNKKNVLMGMKGNGDIGFYASIKADENWWATNGLKYTDNTNVLNWFKEEYAEWSPVWYELFENASVPFIPRPIYCMPLNQNWEALPNLTMLGDAAHVMPPFAGEGANMAMLDALELCNCLTSDGYHTLKEAIEAYELNMRKRASVAAKESLENGERMHSEGSLKMMLDMFGGH
ncbi:MAG: FAD-dependent monooxygenase [Bacteroidetes bacterium]|nr:FAD-dependent monooxygenase [Bacteroidota bacterium]